MIDFRLGAALGPLERAHKDRIRTWRNDPKIYTWCRQNDVISDAEQDRWFERQSLDPSIRMYAVYTVTTAGEHSFCGVAGFTSIDSDNRRAEFSLYVAPTQHRRGVGRKALETLLAHGFLNLGLHVIWGECFQGNPAMHLFSSIGFKTEGVRRQFYFKQGRFIDAHLISLTEDEWRSRRVPPSSTSRSA